MNFSLEDIIKYINFFWSRRKTKHGFLLTLIFVLFLINVFTPIRQLDTLNQTLLNILITISLFIYWTFYSGRRVFSSKKAKIAIALNSLNPESQKVIVTTISKMKDQLKSLNIKRKI